MDSLHAGHRERMRNRYFNNGLENFEPHEVLEMLLYYTCPRKDTNELAHELINHFGSFSKVLSASPDELKKVKGVGDQTAMLLSMVLPIHRMYLLEKGKRPTRFSDSEECGDYLLKYYSDIDKEIFVIMLLDNKLNLLGVENISIGTNNRAIINTKRLVESVLKHNASNVIISHNHPAGHPIPSRPDLNTTLKIKDLLGSLSVRLLDHIIVGEDDYICMARSSEYCAIFMEDTKAFEKPKDTEQKNTEE